jgi:orotidine-5'-phosphate decarboxylase
MNLPTERILVRLAEGDAEEAVRAVSIMKDEWGGFVVGAGLLLDRGPILVGALCAIGRPILVDLGIVDRPAVVAKAVARMAKLGARWVSVSGLGGQKVLEAAVAEAEGYPETSVLVSASMAGWAADSDLKSVGISDTPGGQVSRMTKLAHKYDAGGIIFPARELGVVVQVSRGAGCSGVGNSEGFLRMADTTGYLSSSGQMNEMNGIITGGANWAVVSRSALEGGKSSLLNRGMDF